MFNKLSVVVRAAGAKLKSMASQAKAFAVAAATGVGASLGLGTSDAQAAVPEIVGTTITTLTADAQSIFTTVFPLVAAVLGLVIVIKLFKRFTNKV